MPDIAKAVTATSDSAQTWAQAARVTHDKLNIAPNDFHAAQNMLYSTAKGGGASVAEQTQWIDTLQENRTAGQGRPCGTDGYNANRHEECDGRRRGNRKL